MEIKIYLRNLLLDLASYFAIGLLFAFGIQYITEGKMFFDPAFYISVIFITTIVLIGTNFITSAVVATVDAKAVSKLFRDMDPEKYRITNEKILWWARDKSMKYNVLLNISVGYHLAGHTDKAIDTLLNMKQDTYLKTAKAIYYNNLVTFMWLSRNCSGLSDAYQKGDEYFKYMESKGLYKKNMPLINACMESCNGNNVRVISILSNLYSSIDGPTHIEHTSDLILASALEKKEEAKDLIENMLQSNTFKVYIQNAQRFKSEHPDIFKQ